MKKLFFLIIFVLFPLNLMAVQYTYDLGLTSNDIYFSAELVAGQNIRVYASISNYGIDDVSGYVTFYQGDILIGDSQVVSARAGGYADEVYVDWVVPSGSFNIRAEIRGQNPQDDDSSNDIAITSLFVPKPDSDGDGIPDDQDDDDDNDGVDDANEPILGTDPNDDDSDDDGCLDGADDFPLDFKECTDSDGDGIGDNQDNDDDNDGLSDDKENQMGTDPNNPDSDSDGVIDSQDDFPLDSSKTRKLIKEVYEGRSDEEEFDADTGESSEEIQIEELDNDIGDDSDSVIDTNEQGFDLNKIDQFKISPNLIIKITKKEWNSYVFRPELRGVMGDNFAYLWDFGDGTIVNQRVIEHKFNQPGDYLIKLKVSGDNDIEFVTQKNIKISFFNIANQLVWGIFAGLFLLLFLLLVLLLKKRKEKRKRR